MTGECRYVGFIYVISYRIIVELRLVFVASRERVCFEHRNKDRVILLGIEQRRSKESQKTKGGKPSTRNTTMRK